MRLGWVKTTVGTTTLGAAAIDDVIAWCMLALSMSMINTTDALDALYIFLLVASYAMCMFMLVRPVWHMMISMLFGLIMPPTSIASPRAMVSIFCLFILATAILSKFVGCTVGALCSGLSLRESGAIGVLMNTRGLVELIVLNVALNAHIISEKLFTLMVFMTLTTTMMTTPLLRIIYPQDRHHTILPLAHGPSALHFIIRV